MNERPKRGRSIVAPVALALLIALTPWAANADAIDGDWCREGRHLSIDGPNITTPGGNAIQGDYDRHGFRYTAPAGEKGAGAEIQMQQLSEEVMQLWEGPEAEAQIWNRCDLTS